MGRWSPTSHPSAGPSLGDILAQGVSDFFERRERLKRQPRLDREHEEGRALERARLGVRPGLRREDQTIDIPGAESLETAPLASPLELVS